MRSVAALLLALGLPVLADLNAQVMPQECMALNGHMGCSENHTRICIYKDVVTRTQKSKTMGGSCKPSSADASRKRDVTSRSPVPPPDVLEETYARRIHDQPSRMRWSPRARARSLLPNGNPAPTGGSSDSTAATGDEAAVVPDVAGGSSGVYVPDYAGGSAPPAAAGLDPGLDAASMADNTNTDSSAGAGSGLADNANAGPADNANAGPAGKANPASPGSGSGSGPASGSASGSGLEALTAALGSMGGSNTNLKQQPTDNKPDNSPDANPNNKPGSKADSKPGGSPNTKPSISPSTKPASDSNSDDLDNVFDAKSTADGAKKKKPKFWMTSRECRTRHESIRTCLGGRRMCRFKVRRTGQLRYAPMAGSCRPMGSGSVLMKKPAGGHRHHGPGGPAKGGKGGKHGKHGKSGSTTIVINTGTSNNNNNNGNGNRDTANGSPAKGGRPRRHHPRLRGVDGPTAGAMGGSWSQVKSKMRKHGKTKHHGGGADKASSGPGSQGPELASPWIYENPQNAECNKLSGITGCSGGKVTCIYRGDNGKFHIRRLTTTCSWRIVNPEWRGKDTVA
ncbi:hypothetical protein RB597_001361 [Gaeumannomyces tritici]